MFGLNCKRLLFGVVVAAALVSFASQADAFWGWGFHRGCYSGCYTPCYSPCYTACYTACYTPCYTSRCYTPCYTTCCYPSCGYSCGGCYSSCWSSSCCSTSCCDGTAAAAPAATQASEPTPAQEPGPEPEGATSPPPFEPGIETPTFLEDRFPAAPAAAAPDGTSLPLRETSGMLVVHVPYDAQVTINGLKTRVKGSRRKYVSHGLKPGYSYKYEVRAQVVRDGRPVEEVRTVLLRAGDREAVAFGFNPELTQGLASR